MRKLLVVLALIALATSAQANLLVNGGFESSFDGWGYDFSADSNRFGGPTVGNAVGVHGPNSTVEGDNVYRVSAGSNMTGSYWIYQTIDTVPGTTYNFSGSYAGGVGGLQDFNGTAWWEMGVCPGAYDKNNVDGSGSRTVMGKVEQGAAPGFSFYWTAADNSFTATDAKTTVYFKYGVWTPDWQYNYFGAYADNFSVNAVPEPSSIVALFSGLAGMAGFAIRRKH